MNLEDFTAKFADQFDETDSFEIKSDTRFKELQTWDSLMAMLIIGFVKTEYNINLSNADFENCYTVQDLFFRINVK